MGIPNFFLVFIDMGKRIRITEEQLKRIVKEMAYPVSFNMDEMTSLRSYSARVRYCEQRLTKIGAGSSRIVFAVDDEKVLKVAKNQKGIAQNNEESEQWKQSYDCFAKVYDYSDDGIFLEMQAARKANNSDFKRITGYGFDVMCKWIEYTASLYSRKNRIWGSTVSPEYKQFFNSEKWQEMLDNYSIFYAIHCYMCDYQLETYGDFQRLSSWGVVSENGEESLVLIDFGLSDEIFANYYSPQMRKYA